MITKIYKDDNDYTVWNKIYYIYLIKLVVESFSIILE